MHEKNITLKNIIFFWLNINKEYLNLIYGIHVNINYEYINLIYGTLIINNIIYKNKKLNSLMIKTNKDNDS